MTERGGLAFRNPVKQAGYAMVYHVVTLDTDLSDGSFRLYVLLLRYARQAERCWPGVDRLAQDLGRGRRTVKRYLGELTDSHLITREQRGLGQTAMTYIEDLEDVYSSAKNGTASSANSDAALAVPNLAHKEETEEETGVGDAPTPQQNQVVALLTSFGVTRTVARYLSRDTNPEDVKAWIAYTEQQRNRLTSPIGFLVSKLQAGEEPPEQAIPEDDRHRYLEWLEGAMNQHE
jgi:predicted transcriptional regulator